MKHVLETVYGHIYKCVNSLPKDFTVSDIACQSGWLGTHCLTQGFKFVNFIDARPESFKQPPSNFKNWDFVQMDISQYDLFRNQINDFDVLLYCGHLYHSEDPYQMLKTISETKCKHLIIESKTLDMNGIHLMAPPKIDYEIEPTHLSGLEYHPTKSELLIGRPNLNWTTKTLQELGFKIESYATGVLDNVSYSQPNKAFPHYFIHAVR